MVRDPVLLNCSGIFQRVGRNALAESPRDAPGGFG
jgi:hypothetical protein